MIDSDTVTLDVLKATVSRDQLAEKVAIVARALSSRTTVLVLGGWAWLPPLAGLVATFIAYERLTPIAGKFAKARYEMGTALIGLTVPVVLVLLHASFDDPDIRHALYVGYLASIACQAAVLCFLLQRYQGTLFGGYQVGLEILALNGALSFLALWAISSPRQAAGEALAAAKP